jgi:hypothetical protein
MHLLWMAPAGVAGAGFVLVIGVAAHLTGQARGLRRDVERFSELRPALLALREASDEARRSAGALRNH